MVAYSSFIVYTFLVTKSNHRNYYCHSEPQAKNLHAHNDSGKRRLGFCGYWQNIREVNNLAYVIGDDCVSCGVCESECPVSCISEGGSIYVINEDDCTSCGACASVCPSDAITQK